MRYKVAMGTAEGLYYLHEGCQRRIIHKDIKASNILLTQNFEAQVIITKKNLRSSYPSLLSFEVIIMTKDLF